MRNPLKVLRDWLTLPKLALCSKCNRVLSGARSVERGMGPTCWRKQCYKDPNQMSIDFTGKVGSEISHDSENLSG